MRDSAIIAGQAMEDRRAGLVLAQLEFVKTRQEAMENLATTAPLWMRVYWLLKPAKHWASVDATQQLLLNQAKERLTEMAARPRIVAPGGALARG